LKVIEYILAFIVLMSFIPLFNIAIHSYYTVRPETPSTYVKDIIMDATEKVIKQEYNNGNLTPEIIDINKEIAEAIGPDITRSYAYRLEIFSSIREIIVDTNNDEIIVKTLDNKTLNILILYDNSIQQIMVQQPTMFNNNLYWYIIDGSSLIESIDDVNAIVAILRSRTSMYVGYWFKSQNNIGYALNINDELVLAVSNSITFTPINYYGNNVLNATMIFYNTVTDTYNFYDYRYFELIYHTILYPGYGKEVFLNKTSIRYIGDYDSRLSYGEYTLYPFRVLRIDIPAERTYECYDSIYHDCRLVSESEDNPVLHYSNTSFPIYNALLFILKGENNAVYIPVYRQSYVFGEQYVPNKGVTYVTGYMKIGMFTYNYVLGIWRK